MSPFRCRPVALFLLLLYLGGCYSWRPTTVSPRQAIETHPDRVRITLLDSTTVMVDRPSVVNDSIATTEEICQTGYPGGPRTCVSIPATVLPLSDVATLEVRRAAGGAYVAIAIVVVAAVFFVIQLDKGLEKSFGS